MVTPVCAARRFRRAGTRAPGATVERVGGGERVSGAGLPPGCRHGGILAPGAACERGGARRRHGEDEPRRGGGDCGWGFRHGGARGRADVLLLVAAPLRPAERQAAPAGGKDSLLLERLRSR